MTMDIDKYLIRENYSFIATYFQLDEMGVLRKYK